PTRLFDTITSPVSFSANGREMFFVRVSPDDSERQQIIAAADDGSSARVLLEGQSDRKIAPNAAVSPDGRFVVFGSITRQYPIACSLMKLDLSDGVIAALTDEKWDSCYRIVFTQNGGAIAFFRNKPKEEF